MTGGSGGGRGCAVAVMAKAPVPGHVKTRLIPPLTPAIAAALSAGFLRDITENIALAGREAPIDGYVAYAPAGYEGLFDGMLAPGTGLVLADGSPISEPAVAGFGRCLLHAARALFEQGYEAVCLLNSDSPTLPTALLSRAAAALAEEGDRVVLGAADDGGYYILGLKAPHRHLFETVSWSTNTVAGETRQRAQALGLSMVELEPWFDVDDAAAFARLCRELNIERPVDGLAPFPAPATKGCIERFCLGALLAAEEQAR